MEDKEEEKKPMFRTCLVSAAQCPHTAHHWLLSSYDVHHLDHAPSLWPALSPSPSASPCPFASLCPSETTLQNDYHVTIPGATPPTHYAFPRSPPQDCGGVSCSGSPVFLSRSHSRNCADDDASPCRHACSSASPPPFPALSPSPSPSPFSPSSHVVSGSGRGNPTHMPIEPGR